MPGKGPGVAGAGCALIVCLLVGCSIVAPLNGLTGGVELGFTAGDAETQEGGPASDAPGAGQPDGPNTVPGDDASTPPPPPDSGATGGDTGTSGGQDSGVRGMGRIGRLADLAGAHGESVAVIVHDIPDRELEGGAGKLPGSLF